MNELYNGQEIENIPDTVSIKDIKGIDFSYVHGPININIDRNRIAMCSRDSKIMIANVFKSLVNGIAKSKGAARIALIEELKNFTSQVESVINESNKTPDVTVTSEAEHSKSELEKEFGTESYIEVKGLTDYFSNLSEVNLEDVEKNQEQDQALEEDLYTPEQVKKIIAEKHPEVSYKVDPSQNFSVNNEVKIENSDSFNYADAYYTTEKPVEIGSDLKNFVAEELVKKNDETRIEPVHDNLADDKEPVHYSDNSEYVPENGEKSGTLLERLQKISSEGRIFTDESRFEDPYLSLGSSISLGKIKNVKLNLNGVSRINEADDKILSMDEKKHSTLKKVVAEESKKQEMADKGYKIKQPNLFRRYNQVDKAGEVIAVTKQSLAYKISGGALRLLNSVEKKISSQIEKLKQLREEIKGNVDSYTPEDMVAKHM